MKYSQLPYSPARIQQMFTFNNDDGRLYWKPGVLNHIPRKNHPTLIAGHQRKSTVTHPRVSKTVWIYLAQRPYAALRIAYAYHNGCDPEGVRFIPKDGDYTNMRADNILYEPLRSAIVHECVSEHYNKHAKLTFYRAEVWVDGNKHVKKFHDLGMAVAWRDTMHLTAKKCAKWYAK